MERLGHALELALSQLVGVLAEVRGRSFESRHYSLLVARTCENEANGS